jgi:acetoacetate decarboxylase
MPLFGTLDAGAITAPPRMANLDTEAWALPDAEILQLAFEVGDRALALLPRAMHPAIPFYVSIGVARYPESPVGAFTLAQVRLVGRAGAHPRGLVLGAVASTAEAVAALRDRWGLPATLGSVSLMRYHDRIAGTVVRDGTPILECALLGPEMISPADVQYIASVTLADVPEDGGVRRSIVQVDPHYTLKRADRGRPQVTRFDGAAWGADGIALLHPVSGSITVCDTDLPQIRFVMDPEIPVVRGTRRIR